ncbi:programmed cell death protein 2-like [Diachasmimorpha longicaudata]|uniref:programmed cell death protein 2-like n=1 Tax=Diachasmimorpha longicaudata TaxID=58733 RepID=UPI0030B8A4D1
MACKNRARVYLGYEDEFVTEKHRSLVNFATNKIGGKPDFPINENSLSSPACRLCGLNQLLALQLYAPLESSRYHRTLYIFTCINPNCWNQHDSWTCLRVQFLEEKSIMTTETAPVSTPPTTSWLSGADDWGDEGNDNSSEQNGNNMNDSTKLSLLMNTGDTDEELTEDLSNMRVDDPNANSPASVESPVGGGAVGRLDSPQASAEIEGEESEVVCIDTPTQPQCNLVDLLQEVTHNPFQHHDPNAPVNLTFTEVFMWVEEEDLSVEVSQHERDLAREYQMHLPESAGAEEVRGMDTNPEAYEKSIPKHGDEMFHHFKCRIQKNPGQLIRYCRDNSSALLLTPLSSSGFCRHCGGERIFEVQVLPTIIPKLKLSPSIDRNFQLEFGTVLVFTCSRSCWSPSDAFKEEHVVVQAERL